MFISCISFILMFIKSRQCKDGRWLTENRWRLCRQRPSVLRLFSPWTTILLFLWTIVSYMTFNKVIPNIPGVTSVSSESTDSKSWGSASGDHDWREPLYQPSSFCWDIVVWVYWWTRHEDTTCSSPKSQPAPANLLWMQFPRLCSAALLSLPPPGCISLWPACKCSALHFGAAPV